MNYLTSYFTARTFPSQNYSKPMYLFSSYRHTSISDNINLALADLVGYIYVSDTLRENSAAIYYNVGKDYYEDEYISEFSVTPSNKESIRIENVTYVVNHQSHNGIYSFNFYKYLFVHSFICLFTKTQAQTE